MDWLIQGVYGYLAQIRADVQKQLSIYYETFVDILDFKDHVSELLTTMDACQVVLDIVSGSFGHNSWPKMDTNFLSWD